MKRILTADSGSTKTEWVATCSFAGGADSADTFSGPGLNPHFLDSAQIVEEMECVRGRLGADFDSVRFYGAGVGNDEMVRKMEKCLQSVFNSSDIKADSDMAGAAHAVLGDLPGIACIMGTGSNSCHYDGSAIDRRFPSLGYILDDAGGGVAFCRRLLGDIFKDIAPKEIRDAFHARYNLTVADVLEHLYHHPAPNRWIAGFMPFVVSHKSNPYIATLIEVQLEYFLTREFSGYSDHELKEEGIGFVGSVAAELEEQLMRNLTAREWKLRGIVRKPLEILAIPATDTNDQRLTTND